MDAYELVYASVPNYRVKKSLPKALTALITGPYDKDVMQTSLAHRHHHHHHTVIVSAPACG